jgi:cytoskeleton protein RodZ
MDIGAELRNARTARKLSIEEIARVTKISPSVLRAIDHNDFGRVPGGLFTRGFLRAYAREVGLDPEEIIQLYRQEFEHPEIAVRAEDSDASDELEISTHTHDEPAGSRYSQIVQVAIILIILGVYFASWRRTQPLANTELPPTNAVAAPAPAEVPAATTGRVDAPRSELKVDIHPQGQCWVQATADGEPVMARLMMPGEHETIGAREDLTLRVGDPAAFAFSINGAAGRSLGRAGQPMTVQINRRNFATFLERAAGT